MAKTPTILRRGKMPDLGPGAKPPPAPKLLEIPLKAIQEDHDTQSREAISDEVVAEYAEAEDLPPIDVFGGSGKYWIGDGWHRFLAAKKVDRKAIKARVHSGGKRDAILHSLGANQSHGLRRSNADKRKAVATVFGDPEWSQRSSRWIAKTCGVSHMFVENHRPSVSTVDTENPSRTYIDKHGNTVQSKAYAERGAKPEPHPLQPASTLGHGHGVLSNLTVEPPAKPLSDGLLPIPAECLSPAASQDRPAAAPPPLPEAQWTRSVGTPDEIEEEDEGSDPEPHEAEDEAEASDPDAWIRDLDLYRDLPDLTRPRFEHDCRLWKAIGDAFKAFQKVAGPLLSEARADAGRRTRQGEYIPLDNTLSFFDLTARYQKTRPPRHWDLCRECRGEGQGGLGQPCGSCRGKGYRVN